MQTEQLNQVPLLSETQAADRLHVKTGTLRNWRCQGKGPDYVKLGRNVLYPQNGVARFIESKIVHVQG